MNEKEFKERVEKLRDTIYEIANKDFPDGSLDRMGEQYSDVEVRQMSFLMSPLATLKMMIMFSVLRLLNFWLILRVAQNKA